jgi:DNA invertase Pin-like site-specific DNA recombinase
MSKTQNNVDLTSVEDLLADIKSRTQLEHRPLGGRRTQKEEELIKQNSITYKASNVRFVNPESEPIHFFQWRLSRNKKESVSIDRQNQQTTEMATQLGFVIDFNNPMHIQVPEHGSASKNIVRPKFDAMMKFIETFEGDNPIHIWTYMFDRFTRLEEVWNRVLPILRERNVILHIQQSPYLDIHDRNHDWGFTSLVRVAEGEARHLKQRATDAHKRRTDEGYFRGGPTPIGFKRVVQEGEIHPTLVVNNDPTDYLPDGMSEAAFVNLLYDKVIEGNSTASIARWINGLGIPSRRGSKNGWDNRTLIGMIRNARYAGFQTHKAGKQTWSRFNEKHIAKDKAGNPIIAFEQVVTAEKFYAAVAVLDKKYTKRAKRSSTRLTGLVVCAHCGNGMVGGTGGNGKGGYYPKYRCNYKTIGSCVANSITMTGVDQVVYEMMERWLSNPIEMSRVSKALEEKPKENPERDALVALIAEKEAELEAADKYAQVGIRAVIQAMRDDLDKMDGDNLVRTKLVKQIVNGSVVFEQAWNDPNQRLGVYRTVNSYIKEIRISPVTDILNRYQLAELGWHTDYRRIQIEFQDGNVLNMGTDWAKVIAPKVAA